MVARADPVPADLLKAFLAGKLRHFHRQLRRDAAEGSAVDPGQVAIGQREVAIEEVFELLVGEVALLQRHRRPDAQFAIAPVHLEAANLQAVIDPRDQLGDHRPLSFRHPHRIDRVNQQAPAVGALADVDDDPPVAMVAGVAQ